MQAETNDAAEPLSAPEAHEDPEADTSGAPDPEETPRGNREARYRVERNEARAQRDSLAETLAQLQTKELHRLAGEHLADPADIDLAGNELSHYLTPEGWVDHDAVADAAAAVVSSRPGLSKNSPAYDPSQGHGNRAPKDSLSWGDLLKS
ncbi:MAG: hypothetical protein WBH51_01935 [Mycolicibacter algericus]|uniref:hypothetical protein n=1 Tax=Mycolicibacter algericus TaxID=1288388 RepID=UPI003C72ADB3